MVRQDVFLQHMKLMVKCISTCSLWRTQCQSKRMCLKEVVTPWRPHIGAGSWQDLWAYAERSPHWSRIADRTCDPMWDPCWSSLFRKDCIPWKGHTLEQFVNCSPSEELMLEKFMEDCLLWEGPHTGAGEECEQSCS